MTPILNNQEKMKRIFIAVKVDPGESFLQMITSFKTTLRNENIKWTKPGNTHITLSFIGNTGDEQVMAISAMLVERCEGLGKFELIIKGSGVFKNINDARVIWTGIESSVELKHLNEVIVNGLKNIGVNTEDRYFNPHLTLGRINVLKDKSILKILLDKYQNVEIQKVPVNEVILYESILLPTGPVYQPLNIYKL
jgi:RNA 2',3'-cyclic 3'-phosphodiesterase